MYDESGTLIGTGSVLNHNSNSYDGTTDGERIYLVDYRTGTVVSLDMGFANSTNLFTTSPNEVGITFDSGTGTIWTSNVNNGLVSQWDFTGGLLRQWSGSAGSASALA